MFSQRERVNKTTFPILLREGRTVNSDNISLKYVEKNEPGEKNRYSFVVSSKVSKSAVVRNLLKRRARHAVRKHSSKIKKPITAVFFFKQGANKLDFSQIETEILSLLSRAKII